MIGQRQVDFRNEYRSRIVGWYDGYFHIAIIYAMGAAAFYVYVEHIRYVTALEWLTVPLTFLFTNMFEWAIHKYVMHRPINIKGLPRSMSGTRSITTSFSPTTRCGFVTTKIGG
jgi:hypothetical protein